MKKIKKTIEKKRKNRHYSNIGELCLYDRRGKVTGREENKNREDKGI